MIFTARRAAKRDPDPRDPRGYAGYGPKILCGFGQASMANFCDEVVAWVAEPGRVVIRNGLTDAGTPGHYRLGAYARRALERGDGAVARNRGEPRLRAVSTPIVLPCPKGHENRVDADLLTR